MRNITMIIIHCSATRSDRPFPVTSLIACHRQRFGYTGYHYYITRNGQTHQTRHENLVGAHAKGYNTHSIGICYEGGLLPNGHPADTRTEAQKAALWHLLQSLLADYPQARILGHCELPGVTKTCPNFLASREYADLQPAA
ncbi:N-acetylmuramoyl-L-alanine amidase [Prevotella sp. E13-17]|jgi:N-acetyl-anhydromuramyl-L-alanine amidase AmpD|uniref:N-acetylmuramoyl-L-alanine amidase n=1 Tax=Prevotella sp. E13-17 TaxID=2913616 RepID=UPI001EDA1B1D|nr:N-acetylmuramoyl-L-alanine amidase [Prevotella sp. E13-17]UKK50329.1 N-acetylmuramoyl-L-alanine amidase [Prevotella sp. E13-17]